MIWYDFNTKSLKHGGLPKNAEGNLDFSEFLTEVVMVVQLGYFSNQRECNVI